MHRRLPTEKIHLSPQFYQHIFTSLRPQMWKVSCMPGLREKFLTWPTTNHSDDPLEVLGSSWQQWWVTSACSQSSLQTWKQITSFSFYFLSSLSASLHDIYLIFFFEQKLRHQILDTATTSLCRRPSTDSLEGRCFEHDSQWKIRAAVQLLHGTERC